MKDCELLIIGAGAAGLTAARTAAESGCHQVVLVDSKAKPGGVLLQCAHQGFGQGLTGPQYIEQLLRDFPKQVELQCATTALSISKNKVAVLSGAKTGLQRLRFQELIFAAGCREIPAGALQLAGTRPEGVYTAGQVQEMMNLQYRVPEGPAVILGSGDLGIIMAGQLSASGCQINALVEQREKCGGMPRNQLHLERYALPLLCNSTVSRVYGERKLAGVVVHNLQSGKEDFIPCRTLLIAVGYTPERTLIQGLGVPEWLQLCGNCKAVHSMIEGVIQEGKTAGARAWRNIRSGVC